MLSQVWTIFTKDLKVDFRSKENFISTFFFALVILLIFKFSIGNEKEIIKTVAPGIYWATFLLASILALSKTFQLEKDNACMEALVLFPIDRGVIFLGKMGACFIYILIVQIFVIPLFGLFFYNELFSFFGEFLIVCVLATFGFTSLGTLLAAITTDLRFSDILLPVLLFPLLVPLLLASINLTEALFNGQSIFDKADWLKLLLGFDGIFFIASYLTFDFVMDT
jgi:heme exporter protein B